ncbi:hypothetical protein CKF54_07730 [Psittacicella hinzii]|uniref:DUF805 domain-containing protein n=1 Tax=Psittacicella hinzii TaxID=2028575 RepID=A0A3A1Y0W2_9GAMM|nr:hypothetical protein [Psittacicella hinzii]RIY31091.1 hypothetical protein CKF54_07730 [Psittacicella hinzii]
MQALDFPEYLPFKKNFLLHYSPKYYFNYRGKESLYTFWRYALVPLLVSILFYLGTTKIIALFDYSSINPAVGANFIFFLYFVLFVLPTTSAIARRLNTTNFHWSISLVFLVALIACWLVFNGNIGVLGYYGEENIEFWTKLSNSPYLLVLTALYPIPFILCASDKNKLQASRQAADDEFNWKNPKDKSQKQEASKPKRR